MWFHAPLARSMVVPELFQSCSIVVPELFQSCSIVVQLLCNNLERGGATWNAGGASMERCFAPWNHFTF